MDYRQFFEELKYCYLSRGLSFDYDFEKSVSKGCNSAAKHTQSLHVLNKKSLKESGIKNYLYSNSDSKVRNRISEDFKKILDSEKMWSTKYFYAPRLFYSVGDMVYGLAWELALKIGKLPDALHSRMVFSLDGHRATRMYIKEFGV